MDIRTALDAITLDSVGVNMLDGEKSYINLQADQSPGLMVWLIDPVKFNIIDLTFLREDYPIVMLFLRKTNFDDTPTDRRPSLNDSRQDVRKFVASCRDNKQLVKDIKNVSAIEVYNLFDANYSGYMLTFNIELVDAGPACY